MRPLNIPISNITLFQGERGEPSGQRQAALIVRLANVMAGPGQSINLHIIMGQNSPLATNMISDEDSF